MRILVYVRRQVGGLPSQRARERAVDGVGVNARKYSAVPQQRSLRDGSSVTIAARGAAAKRLAHKLTRPA